MTGNNPLRQFFRIPKLYVSLPSGTSYYDNTVVEFTDDGELGILPMTATDEMTIKNPDSLLNGEAIIDIIKSCVPSVKNPRKLLSNDIDKLLVAIRHASYGDNLEISANCPDCSHENTFELNISQTMNTDENLEAEYFITTAENLTIYVKPFTFNEVISSLKTQFEQYQAAQRISDEKLSDEQRLKLFSESAKKITTSTVNLLSKCVYKIATPDVEVTQESHIKEFILNTDKTTFNKIDQQLKTINSIGIRKEFKAKCSNCGHEWESPIDFNPVSFFTNS